MRAPTRERDAAEPPDAAEARRAPRDARAARLVEAALELGEVRVHTHDGTRAAPATTSAALPIFAAPTPYLSPVRTSSAASARGMSNPYRVT
jgi:hypothetical protein